MESAVPDTIESFSPKGRLLIIDDDEDVRYVMRQYLETLYEIRRFAPDLKVVFVTAMTDDQSFARLFDGENSVDGFLNKPLLPAHINRCLDVVLARGGKYMRAA